MSYFVISVSSTLIQIPRWGNVLLDCGEGTWGQMARMFGDDADCSTGAWQALRELKCIYISHIHGDHHIGLAKLLSMRRKVCICNEHHC
jgi:ribonuclease Z